MALIRNNLLQEELKTQRKNVRFQMIQMQHHLELAEYQKQHLMDSSVKLKLSGEFAEMKSLIEVEEKIAAKLIEEEESKATGQIDGVLEQLGSQLTQLKQYKEQLDSALANTGSMVFWKNIAELPVISLDASNLPKPIEIDGRKVELVEKVVVALKQALGRQMKCSLEQRVRQLEQAERNKSKPSPNQTPKTATDEEQDPQRNKSKPSPNQTPKTATDEEQDPRCTPDQMEPSQTTDGPEGKQAQKKRNKSKPSPNQTPKTATDKEQDPQKTKSRPSSSQNQPSSPYKEGGLRTSLPAMNLALSRAELMHYNSKITYDHRTAHKKLVINDRFTVLSLVEQPQSYPDQPERFINCSQVLGLQSFTNGRHYWEVSNDGGSFWAIGIACVGVDRRGSRSRLGRNVLSWCVESFGRKLSAWHGDREMVLNVQLPRVVGVFLDFAAGHVAFYSVSNVPMLLISYKTEFQSRVFPAFWLCSKDAKLTLVQ
ncbi:E3 ubiquitin/ISG15 ligase TRIM25-like isoform X4 [Mustelus asterias]